MPRSRALILLTVLAPVFAAHAGQTGQVISIDTSENIYIDNVPANSDLSELAKQRGPLFLRVDARKRSEAMCRVLVAATTRPTFLGQPKNLTKSIPIGLAPSIEAAGAIPVTAKAVGSSWTFESDSIIVHIDFDGTMTWNLSALLSSATLDERFDELAVQRPHARIYIQPDKLSKTADVENVAASAKRNGFSNITIACPK